MDIWVSPKMFFFLDLCWNTNEWTLNPKFFPEISSGLDLAALWSSDFSKIDFFHEMKESGAEPCFFAQISWNLEVLKVLGWIFSQIWKKIWGVKNYPFSSIIHVSIVFGNGHLQSAGPKILGHIYRWKDIEKFYPVKVVRAWAIYMASCKIQLKLSIFCDFADFVESC